MATAGGSTSGSDRRPAIPPPRTVLFGFGALLLVVGGGTTFWGLPVTRPPLGRPGTFSEAPVTASDLAGQRASNSPMVAADPTAPQFVVAGHRVDGPEPGCGLQVSGDGGKSWVAGLPPAVLPPGVERCSAPEVAFDRRGTLHYLFAGLAGPDSRPVGAFLTTSSDRGRTFSPARQVIGPLAYGVRMAVNSTTGRIHLAWLQAGDEPSAHGFTSLSNSVMTSQADGAGAPFAEPQVVSGSTGRRVAAPSVAVGADGQAHVAYYDLGDDARDYEGGPGFPFEGRWALAVASSTPSGEGFAPAAVVDDEVVAPYRVPSIFTMAPPALVAGRQRTCLAWTDAREGDADVLLRCSSKNGRWGPARRVNDDPRGNGVWQYLPQLALAPNGRLDVAFYDRRISIQRNDRATVGFAYSYDGRQFSGNIALTRSSFDPVIGPPGRAEGTGITEFGSRLGLVSEATSALVAWTDTRNGRPGAAAQDVYSAEATLLFASARPPWAVPAGLALVVVGAGTMAGLRRRRPAP